MRSLDQLSSPATAGKAAQIIAAAREAFLEQGYDGISVDEVAKRAGVAKQTVYARYASKDALFLAVVDSVQASMPSAVSTTGPLAIRDRLQWIARQLLEVALEPSMLSLFRITLAVSHRFPTLGRSIYETRVKEAHAIIVEMIERAVKEGTLLVDDASVAAEQFFGLVRGELQFHCLLDPRFRPSRAQIKRQLDAAIDCFMARYGAPAALRSSRRGRAKSAKKEAHS